MNFSWYLGFGWTAPLLCTASGLASYYFSDGWLHWMLYVLFVTTAAYILIKIRLYWKEPWHRVNARALRLYRHMAGRQAAAHEDWNPNPAELCGELARQLLGEQAGCELVHSELFADAGRKEYYRQLVEANSPLFTARVKPEQRAEALGRIFQDIEASELGPDIVIAIAVEKKYGRLEAARYFLALVSGLTMRQGLFS